jgi:two-component system alkaline phosphatase synthesis response regulator PhoP
VEGMWGATDKVSVAEVTLSEAEVPHVLIVEDEPSISALIETTIQGLGYDTTCAFSGGEALRLLDGDQFDLMILEVMLGQTSGWDVLKEFNRRGFHDHTRVMMLTARRSELDEMHARNLGVDEYMTKPFVVDGLIEAVQRLVVSSPKTLKQERESELQRARILALVEGAFGEES